MKEARKTPVTIIVAVTVILTSLDKGTQPFVVCDG